MKQEANPVRLVVVPLEELREFLAEVVLEQVAELLAEARQPPALLDRAGLAQALDVSTGTVDRLRREGCPHMRVGDSARFQLPEVLAWLKGGGG